MKKMFGRLGAVLCVLALTTSLAMSPVRTASAKAQIPGNLPDSLISLGPGYVKLDDGSGEELKGVWISYLTWDQLPDERIPFQQKVSEMMDNCRSWGLNAVFVHVRSHSDAMYQSSVFPWSEFVSGKQGKDPGYDPLQYVIEAAHARGLKVHAWINPYRITGYRVSWEELSPDNPARRWRTDSDAGNDRYVLCHDGQYYYNPSCEAVKQLVVEGARELARGYDVDGIHLDDYFYPTLDDSVEGRQFDLPEYLASGSSLPVVQWRRNHVSDLVRRINQAVKAEKPGIVFGISPQGNVRKLESDREMFVDIERWMTEDGFVDYIMPQLYWGFEARTGDGALAPYSFDANLGTWIDLKRRGRVKLYLGLALYRGGSNVADHNEVSEWLRRDDIISRQVQAGRSSGQVDGYCFYDYESFLKAAPQKEVEKLLPLLR